MKKWLCVILMLCLLQTSIAAKPSELYEVGSFDFRAMLDESFMAPENAWVYDISENGLFCVGAYVNDNESYKYNISIHTSKGKLQGIRPDRSLPWNFRFEQKDLEKLSENPFDANLTPKTHHYLMLEILYPGTEKMKVKLWMSDDPDAIDDSHTVSSIAVGKIVEHDIEIPETNDDLDEEEKNIKEIELRGFYYDRQHLYNEFDGYKFYSAKRIVEVYAHPLQGVCAHDQYDYQWAGAAQADFSPSKMNTKLSFNNKKLTITAVNADRTQNGQPYADMQLLHVKGNAGSQLYIAYNGSLLQESGTRHGIRFSYSKVNPLKDSLLLASEEPPSIALDLFYDSQANPIFKEAVLHWEDGNLYRFPASQLTCAGNFVERYLPVLYPEQADTLLQTLQPQEPVPDNPDAGQIAQRLQTLGLFSGTDTGFDLESPFTRAQGAAMLVRLMGMEPAALASPAGSKFADVPASHWAAPYVSYCAQSGITNGTGDITFSPDDPMTGAQYATLLLRAAGYTDAQPDTAFARAVDTGLLSSTQSRTLSAQTPFLRSGMVQLSWGALKATGANGKTMTETLISHGVITTAQAQQAHLLSPPQADSLPQGDLAAMTEGILDFS